MICSMTGYAAKTRECAGGSLHLELKSVNSRFLDIHFRLADELRAHEQALRERIVARVARGKVECRLSLGLGRGVSQQVNVEVLSALQRLEAQVRAAMPAAQPLSVSDVLRWPGICGDAEVDAAALAPDVLALAEQVLDEFVACRRREGERLAEVILARSRQMRAVLARVEPHIPAAQAAFAAKLKERLEAALGSADDARVLQEVALFAARIDVDEELARLKAHLDELERIFTAGGAVGKRLDFLMQELNREANTLGSKAVVTEVTSAAMELKLLIEQMREQVQNLE
ncbi:MAG: YicC family protein [Azovibrio sp.]|nr:YicC family protein [Azovibrio sp.]